MKKIKNFVIGGLQQKIFNLVLITVIMVAAAFLAVVVYQTRSLRSLVSETNEKQQSAMEEVISSTMDEVIYKSLGTSTRLEAAIADMVFNELKGEVTMLGEYAAKLYAQPWLYSSVKTAPPDPEADGSITAQFLTENGVQINDSDIWKEAGLIGNMADMMETLFVGARVNSCFIGTQNGLFLIVDDDSGSKFTEEGQLKEFPVRERPWYTGAKESGGLFFTDVELDAFTGNIGIVCSMPVYADGGRGSGSVPGHHGGGSRILRR